jgi:ABC-2 type transport system permease protein
VSGLLGSVRAELLRPRRWPAVWVLVGVWFALDLAFVYVFNYVAYRTGSGSAVADAVPRAQLLADLMPGAVPVAAVQGTPLFGGAILMILGALAVGSGYGWGTWKTVFTQGPGRLTATGGTLVALLGIVVALVAATFVVDLGIASALATAESRTIVWPAVVDVARAIGGGVLIFAMWMLAGVAVGTLARGPALAVGLGLVWVLAVENLLRGVGSLLDWLQPVTDVLPGTAAGSVAAAVGATPVSEGGTPGVVSTLAGGTAVAVALGYVVAFVVTTGLLVRHRDLA